MKEEVLNTLKKMGFELDELGKFGYGFEYEGHRIAYIYNENDDSFLNIAVPYAQEMDNYDELTYYQIMDHINSKLKYVKAYRLEDDIWLFVERELFEGEDLHAVLMSAITHLDVGLGILHRAMEMLESDDDNTDEEDDSGLKDESDE